MGTKGFCYCVSVHVCVLILETRHIKDTAFEGKNSSLEDSKSSEIKGHHELQSLLSIRVQDSIQGTLGRHCLEHIYWEISELQNSWNVSEMDFPLHNLQLDPSVFFLFPETAGVYPYSLHTSHSGVVSHVHKHRKSFFLHAKERGHHISMNKHTGCTRTSLLCNISILKR